MKNSSKYLIALFLFAISACQKDKFENVRDPKPAGTTNSAKISIQQARAWLDHQPDSIKNRYSLNWGRARSVATIEGNRIAVSIPGVPTVNGIRLGYRQLSIVRNEK